VSFFGQLRFWVTLGVVFVALFIVQQIWQWEVERTEVAPGEFLVRIHKFGNDLDPDDIVAPDDSYKGVMLEVLPEGRHFINPIFWSVERHKMVRVPPGQCLVLTRKHGKRLADREILAGEGERGIVRHVLLPGSYRLNPYAFSWESVPATEVKPEQVGVRTLKIGKDPRKLPPDPERGAYVVPDGYRGMQQTPVRPGTYYVNPFVEKITPVEVRSHRVELTDIQFPSRDGFILRPHVLVEYRVQPEKAPEMLVRLTDAGVLHQGDATLKEQEENEILQKIILPHIRGYARIEGSNFDARDFIVTATEAGQERAVNSREKLQKALFTKVKPRCKQVGVDIRDVKVASMEPPPELTGQISERELARVELDKNKTRLGQYKAEQTLKAAEALKQQAKEKVEAETRLVQAKTRAQQRKQVEEARLKQDLDNAQLRLDAARLQAEATLAKGKAEAAVIHLQNEAEVAGLRKAVQGFGSAQDFAQYHIVSKLAPALKEIFASDDSEFARMFAAYLTPPNKSMTATKSAAAETTTTNGKAVAAEQPMSSAR
jgi:uncharacterized membrane protein YqiK